MKSKSEIFRNNLITRFYDIAMITETWLNDDINTVEIGLYGYNVYRLDIDLKMSTKKGGGRVLIVVHSSIFSPVTEENVEQIFVLIKTEHKKMILGCIYLPEYSSNDVNEDHYRSVQALAEINPNTNWCCMGTTISKVFLFKMISMESSETIGT